MVILNFTPDIKGRTSPRAPIFVVGCPRSGTTAVGEVIGRANGVNSVGESLFIRYFWTMICDLDPGLLVSTDVSSFRLNQLCDCSGDVFGTACDRLFDALSGEENSEIVDHTPWNGVMIPLLLAMYPRCRIVHVIRNPLSVSKSLLESYRIGRKWATDDILYHARLWTNMVNRIHCDSNKIIKKNYFPVRYEDILLDPIAVLSGLIAELGFEWNDEMGFEMCKPHSSNNPLDCKTFCVFNENGNFLQRTTLADVTINIDIHDEKLVKFAQIVRECAEKNGYVISYEDGN
jgi:hypothetical protein